MFNQHPTQEFVWPSSHSPKTQIAQLKAAGITGASASANTQIKSPSTQGLPKAVSNVNITKMNSSNTQAKVTVSFTHNPGDPYFTSAQVYATVGNASPVLVSGGNSSPVVFTMNRTNAPVTITVVSQGNWGSTAIENSPSKSVSLA